MRPSLRTLTTMCACVVLLGAAACSSDDAGTGGTRTTTTAAGGRTDGGPTQDLWVLHDLRAVEADGDVLDVLGGVVDLAATPAGDPVELGAGVTFTPSEALGAHLRTMDGEERDGVEVVGGVLRKDDVELAAVLATPDDGGKWPGADDLVSFAIPEVGAQTPLVGTIELVQLLPAALASGADLPDDDLELLSSRFAAGSFEFAATSGGDPLVFTGQVGTTFELSSEGGDPLGSVREHRVAFAQAGGGAAAFGGVPAKARPLVDGIAEGVAGCDGLGIECVKDLLDSIEDGASDSNDMLNDNFPPPPPPPPPSPPPPPPRPANYCKPTCADSDGEPHLVTFDGVRYDVQLVGEFVAARSDDVEVQVRTAPYASSRLVAVNDRVALGADGHIIAVAAGDGASVLVDGEQIAVGAALGASTPVGDDLALVRTAQGIDVLRGEDLVLTTRIRSTMIGISVPGGPDGTLWEGLLGDNDGDPDDDLRSRDGDVVESEAVEGFYELHADTWRVADEESLFTYEDGESTETFTDRTFPDERVSAETLDASVRAQAEALCELAGLESGAALDACVLDFALTGDIVLVHAAQAQQAMIRALAMSDPGAFDEALGASTGAGAGRIEGEELRTLRGNGPAVGDGVVLLRTRDADDRMQLRAIEVDTSAVRWQVPDVALSCRPVVVPGVGVVAQLQDQEGEQTDPLALLSLEDGEELGRFSPARDEARLLHCPEALSAAGDTVLLISGSVLHALDAGDGLTSMWSVELDRPTAAIGVDGQVVVAVRPTDDTTALLLLDPATGEEQDRLDLTGARFQSPPGVLTDVGNSLAAVLTADHGDERGAVSVVEVADGSLSLRWSEQAGEDQLLDRPLLQVARAGDLLAAVTSLGGESVVVALDLATGEELWRHEASSFDNSAGQIVAIGDRGVAITPFGGEWIEVVGVDGSLLAAIEPPDEQMVAPMISTLDDGRLAVVGRLEGDGVSGVFVSIVDVP